MPDRDNGSSRISPIRRGAAVVLVLAALGLWLLPSDVIRLIADQDHVLLGRYTVERLSAYLVLSGLGVYLAAILAFQKTFERRDLFKLVTVVLSVTIGIVVVDVAGRLLRSQRYVEGTTVQENRWPGDSVQGLVRSRPPDLTYEVSYSDEPPTARSYPDAPPGFPPVDLVLTVDSRGFRNQEALERAQIVTLGDSFTEGSRVSDEEMWPVLLGRRVGRSVYNLGISGGSPGEYMGNLTVYGIDRRPETVVLMIYEGNDLRAGGLPRRLRRPIKTSPIRNALKRAMIEYLGPINADGPVPESDLLSWMPVKVGQGASATYYAFKPKRLAVLYAREAEFRESAGWRSVTEVLRGINTMCAEHDSRLVIVYAPTKARVVMETVGDELPPGPVRDFVALKRGGLPPADEYVRTMRERLAAKENVVREFCEDEGIQFVSVAGALGQAMAAGTQVYYTYDQHWTRLGHVVAAEVLAGALASGATEYAGTAAETP